MAEWPKPRRRGVSSWVISHPLSVVDSLPKGNSWQVRSPSAGAGRATAHAADLPYATRPEAVRRSWRMCAPAFPTRAPGMAVAW